MADISDNAVNARKKFVEAWNNTMIDIWEERIYKLGVIDTEELYRSPVALKIMADKEGRYLDVSISEEFLEYGIWQDLGTGRGVSPGNTHRRDNDGWENKRKPRRWFSKAYYSSTLNLRDFMADSIGKEFVGMFANLDSDSLRRSTKYYQQHNP